MTTHQHAVMRIFASELDVVLDETAGHRDIETGGALFGLWTHGTSPTIFLATRPGHGAQRHRAWFGLDPVVYQNLESVVWSRYGIQRLGLWHSHHSIGLHDLSTGDLQRAAEHAARSHRFKLCDLLCYFVDTPDSSRRHPAVAVKPHVYRDAEAGDLLPTRLEVLPGTSPIREALSVKGDLTRALESCLEAAHHDVGPDYRIEPFLPDSRYVGPSDAESAQPSGHGSGRRMSFRKLLPGSGGESDAPKAGDDEPGPLSTPGRGNASASEHPGATLPPEDQESVDRGDGNALPPVPAAEFPQAHDEERDLLVIGDPAAFLNYFVAPTFDHLDRRGIRYVLNPSSDARTISCDLIRKDRGARVLLILGWNGHEPVIAECVWSDGRSGLQQLPMNKSSDRHDVTRALRWAESVLVSSPRRKR